MRRAIALAVAAPWLVWAVVRTFGLDPRYPVVAVVAFTPYAALTSPLPVVVALVLRLRALALVPLAAAVALAVAVVPRAFAGPDPVAHGPMLTVMTSNLRLGLADPEAVLAAARRYHVNVLNLEELTPEEYARLQADGLDALYPGRVADPRPGSLGTAALVDRPLEAAILPPGLGRSQPIARFTVPGAPLVTVTAVHPAPPINEPRARAWEGALRTLPSSDSRGDVQILAGDFNATLDHSALRGVLDRGYLDAADAVGQGFVWTWPALPRRALPITIDHVLVDRRVHVRSVTVIRIPGTDHRALIARLELPAG